MNLWQNMPNVKTGSYYSTSPPIIAKGLIVVGGAVNDNVSTTEPSGVIRAFDINSGKLVWNWDSKNPTETAPIAADARYSENSPNSWSISSYDPILGLIFIPMGNQPPDQFGGNRDKNVETYASSVVALNVETGAVAWVFQSTHHDLWDMDVPAQPALVDLNHRWRTPFPRWWKPPNRASYSCSIAEPENRCYLSRKCPRLRGPLKVTSQPRPSPSPDCLSIRRR